MQQCPLLQLHSNTLKPINTIIKYNIRQIQFPLFLLFLSWFMYGYSGWTSEIKISPGSVNDEWIKWYRQVFHVCVFTSDTLTIIIERFVVHYLAVWLNASLESEALKLKLAVNNKLVLNEKLNKAVMHAWSCSYLVHLTVVHLLITVNSQVIHPARKHRGKIVTHN